MPEQARAELLAEAARMREAMADLGAKFETTERFAREARRLARWLEAAFIGLLLIVIALTITTIRANNANDKATRLGEYQVANCDASNETRAEAKAMWDYVVTLFPTDSPVRAQLQAKANKTYGPRDCTKVAEGKVR